MRNLLDRGLRFRRLQALSTACIVCGVLLLISPVPWMIYTGRAAAEVQTQALTEWESSTARVRSGPAGEDGPFPSGMVLTIPHLGLRRFVPDGATPDHLRRFGVGRITWTALPDADGIVAIAGHRTTHGAPFYRLDRLEQGDAIVVDFQGRRYTYRVDRFETVRPTQVEVLQAHRDPRAIALVTCTPAYSAAYRLVVLGHLETVDLMGAQP